MKHLRVLLWKELLDLMRNRAALVPVVLVTIVAFALPITIMVVIPVVTGEQIVDDADLLKVSRIMDMSGQLSGRGRVQLFLFQQFLLLFLLTPITGAMSLAAHAVVGEKQARTLEPLLATPVSTIELLVAKVVGAFLPTVGISMAGLLLFFGVIPMIAEPGVLRAMLGVRTWLLVLLVGPAITLVSLQAALAISSRVNDPRTAQQFSVLIVVPLTAVLVAQFTGSMWLSSSLLVVVGLGLFGVWLMLIALSAVLFEREAILTRWR